MRLVAYYIVWQGYLRLISFIYDGILMNEQPHGVFRIAFVHKFLYKSSLTA